nr:WD40 YVTN repeat containing domain [Hymenolepis microstoma]
MDDEESTINSVLERLIKVRDEGKSRVVELTKINEDNKKTQITNANPTISPLVFAHEEFSCAENVPLNRANLRTLEGIILEMAQAPLILTSMADCGKQDAAVVWDPIPGNPVASFSGEVVSPGTLTVSNGIIFSAVHRKPIIQAWSFRSNSSSKRISTKGPVNALAFSDDGSFMYVAIEKSVYVYQTCGGCLIAILEASHMAPIGALTVSQARLHSALPLPLLLSSDTSGLVACWPALLSPDDNFNIGNTDSSESSKSHHNPLWYVVQASRGLTACAFVADGRMVACAGTDGLKLFASETGKLLHSTLLESLPLLCICALPQDDRYIFAGTDNGILHSVWLRESMNPASYEVSLRRCFTDSELSSTEKAITGVCASPIDCGFPLLVVSTRGCLVEVLRQDSTLMRLQSFSLFPSVGAAPRLTGIMLVPRPSWLLDAQSTSVGERSTDNMRTKGRDALDTIQPIKRHVGWQPDDTLYIQLSNNKRHRMARHYLEDVYHDAFPRSKVTLPTVYATNKTTNNFNKAADEASDVGPEYSTELSALKREKEALQARNGELMRILVANCLHY